MSVFDSHPNTNSVQPKSLQPQTNMSEFSRVPMRVVHIIRHFLPFTQTFIFDHLIALQQLEGIDSEVLFYGKSLGLAENYKGKVTSTRQLAEQSLSAYERAGIGLITLLGKKNKRYEDKRALRKYLSSNQVSVLHCHFAWVIWQLLFHAYVTLPKRPGLVISVHGTDILVWLEKEKNQQNLQALSRLPQVKIVATSGYLEKKMVQKGIDPRSIAVVANSVNPIFAALRDQHLTRDQSVFQVVHNGRFVRWKGHRYLLEAFAAFVESEGVTARLTLIGDGELRAQMEKMALDLGIAQCIDFVGYCSHSKVAEILCRADVYVHPSIYDRETGQEESFGVAILEAMSVGLPIIATNSGGIPYAVGATSSFVRLVDPESSTSITKELIDIYRTRLYLESNLPAVSERLEEVSSEHHLASYLALYEEVKHKCT